MFIKLTRFDNRPVWLNAGFIVTVEPRREGSGAVVVPIGDGLDYDVRETPEEVLAMLEGAPVPAVVPVTVSDGLSPTPADVSPDSDPRGASEPAAKPAAAPAAEKPKKRPVRARKAAAKKDEAVPAPEAASAEAAAAPEPEVATGEAQPAASEMDVFAAVVPVKKGRDLTEADFVRLRKMAPKSVGKLKNTVSTQFHVADAEASVAALVKRGFCAIEGNRVLWKEGE